MNKVRGEDLTHTFNLIGGTCGMIRVRGGAGMVWARIRPNCIPGI